MNKQYLEYTSKAHRLLAQSYEMDAEAYRSTGEDDKVEFYVGLAKSAHKNADSYESMVASYDE